MADQIIVIPENEYFIVQDVSGGGAGNDGRGITDAEIIGTDLVLSFTSAPSPVNVGRVVGEDGTNGTNGTDGNGITAITQPSDFVMRVETRDFAPVNINLFQGPSGANGTNGTNGTNGINGATWYQGSGAPSVGLGVNNDFYLNTTISDVSQKQSGAWVLIGNIKGANGTNGTNGATGPAGPSSLLEFINKQSFFDHLMPAATGTGITINFQSLVRSGAGTAAFRNTQTIGGGGQITLNSGGAGASGSTDLSIRRGAGLSGGKIGTTPIDYIFCFYADTLQTSGDSSVFRLCAQNDNTASITPAN